MFKSVLPNACALLEASGRHALSLPLGWLVNPACLCALTLVAAGPGCGGGRADEVPELSDVDTAPEDDLPLAQARLFGSRGGKPDAFSAADRDGGMASGDCGTATTDRSEAGDASDCRTTGAYQPCDANQRACTSLGPNTLCASYTTEPENSFCAPFCRIDEACPTIEGFGAACNFYWCAVLCEDGRCPTGMICQPGATFIDTQGVERGVQDVCVIAP